MIEYVIAHNPDDRVLKKASDILNSGGLVCLPTDTNWQVLANPYKKESVEKLYLLKKENQSKHFSLLCSSISMASDLAHINDRAFKLLNKITPGHYTFIFEATKKIAKIIKATKTDKEIGIRFVPSVLVEKLIEVHGEAVISTNLSSHMVDTMDDGVIYSYMIEEKFSHLFQMIIDPGEIEFAGISSILNLMDEENFIVLREGAGDISFL
jgi:tRNA threonylcarbamoyl adenosine modification protein (Sua5/YciO/YrdC/YwlC family)